MLLGLTTTCGTPSKENGSGSSTNDVVLINSTGERCEIGRLISSLMKCNPKVIGVNFLYEGKKGIACDTLLRSAIKKSGKVILVEGFRNEEHVTSDNDFKEVSMFSCVSGLVQSHDGVTDYYYRISDNDEKWRYSFPFHLALQYDKSKAPQLASKSHPKYYPINFYKQLADFKVFDPSDIANNVNEFEGKIVLIGDLESDEDLIKSRVTDKSSSQSFATVISANVVIDILRDLETQDVPINKYAEFIRQQEMKEN